MSIYTTRHYDVLLVQMYKNMGILQLATSQLEALHLSNPTIGCRPVQAFMFLVLKEYYTKHRMAPDLPTLRADMDARVAVVNPFGATSALGIEVSTWRAEFETLIPIVNENSLPMVRDLIAHVHRVCVYEPQVAQATEQARETGDLESLGPQLTSLTQAHLAVKGTADVRAEVEFGVEGTLMRIPTYIPWLDKYLGEGQGMAAPSAVTIIAGQGYGKTTFGVQLACAQALMGKHVVLALAENGWSDRLVKLSALACITGIPLKTLEGASKFEDAVLSSGLPPETCHKARQAMSDYIHIVDLAKSGGDLAEVDAKITQLRQSGIPVAMAYIDWAGIIAERIMNSPRPGGRKFKDKREALESLSMEAANMAERHNMLIFISQQMNIEYVRKGRFGVYDMGCAHEARMFTAPCKYVIVITATGTSTERHGDIQVVELVKARGDAPKTRMLVRRNPINARFEEAIGLVQKGKHFVDATASAKSDFTIPTEKKRNNEKTE